MTVQSGGPHLLLFERDQQLTALLTSEFQLAGYECHAARTAVEVFDAIARFPIRLVLVNLAQAAAGRREFWVALDAQRRGRGVQVFTFRCMNIAGYGPDDPDERSRTVLTDMEVDGMLGIMNLVDAVRGRIPSSTTGSYARVRQQAPFAPTQAAPARSVPGQANGQSTAPLSTIPSAPPQHSGLTGQMPQPQPGQVGQTGQTMPPRTGIPAPTFTDKIRAVMHPGNRASSPSLETNWMPHMPAGATGTQQPVNGVEVAMPGMPTMPPLSAPAAESSLSQLSRMVRETSVPLSQPEQIIQPQASGSMPALAPAAHDLSLRPSPIEDELLDRPQDRRVSPNVNMPAQAAQAAQAAQTVQEVQAAQDVVVPTLQLSAITPATIEKQTSATPAPDQVVYRVVPSELKEAIRAENEGMRGQGRKAPVSHDALIDSLLVEQRAVQEADEQAAGDAPEPVGEQNGNGAAKGQTRLDMLPDMQQMLALRKRGELSMASEDVLLDIVQSLPPMSALPTPVTPPSISPAAVLSGRATRSLANVLLEGHLVAENRLGVAQDIQRMLRGVDMNYQLGEILLMFKLLTPDQLLAASLVSYGLISGMQISALGRIRQELYGLGLEYDLESLLVLFRMMTPDQLREVRASWTA